MAHPDGEEATARACGSYGTVMGLSSFSTTSLEDVKSQADAARTASGKNGPSECVMQMYLFENRATTDDLVRRAEAAGYKAIVLTVDTPYFGRRLTEIRNRFRLPPHLRMANFPESLGVKTGSQHRTDDLSKGGSSTTTVLSTPSNKNGQSMSNVSQYSASPVEMSTFPNIMPQIHLLPGTSFRI